MTGYMKETRIVNFLWWESWTMADFYVTRRHFEEIVVLNGILDVTINQQQHFMVLMIWNATNQSQCNHTCTTLSLHTIKYKWWTNKNQALPYWVGIILLKLLICNSSLIVKLQVFLGHANMSLCNETSKRKTHKFIMTLPLSLSQDFLSGIRTCTGLILRFFMEKDGGSSRGGIIFIKYHQENTTTITIFLNPACDSYSITSIDRSKPTN